MTTAGTPRLRFLTLGLAAAAVAGLSFGFRQPESIAQTPTPKSASAAQPAGQPDDRPADRAAVQKMVESLAGAFNKADAKALAAHWAAEGEYTSEDGVVVRGRPALEKAYTEFFGKNPGVTLGVEVDLVRFPSRDTTVVESHLKLRKGKGGELAVSRCNFLCAREDGKWLIAIARERPGDGLTLRDLDWLIGTWEAKREGPAVRTTYEWTPNKSFIRCRFSITQEGKTHSGMQMIGKDPASGALRVWTFEDEGGLGEADIVRDGKKWLHRSHGVTPDGRHLTATNIMTPVDADSFLWHAVERTLDGEPMPDLPPIKVTRVKGNP